MIAQSSLGPSTQATIDAARRRGIPCRHLDNASSLVRLGWSIHARTIQATISSQTNAMAVDISQ